MSRINCTWCNKGNVEESGMESESATTGRYEKLCVGCCTARQSSRWARFLPMRECREA